MAPNLSLLVATFLLLLVTESFIVQSQPSKPKGQAFDFLQTLKGSRKGQTVKGLQKLKQYLKNFGYLKNNNATTTHANDDVFDNQLETAVKMYQANYHLKVSGILDSNTIKAMMQPRCGVADSVYNNNTISTSNIVSHYTFFWRRPKWPPEKTLLVHTFKSSSPVVPIHILRSVCARAFAKWQQKTHFTFREAEGGKRADIVIGMHRRFHGFCPPFDGRGGTLAHATPPTLGKLHCDADENWSTNVPIRSDQVDLESVAMHEIGHLLGLAHSKVFRAVMFPIFNYGQIKRNLHPDDIEGIRTLYKLI